MKMTLLALMLTLTAACDEVPHSSPRYDNYRPEPTPSCGTMADIQAEIEPGTSRRDYVMDCQRMDSQQQRLENHRLQQRMK